MTENELLAELLAELNYPAIEPDEVTSKILEDATGHSDNWCMNKLRSLEAAGRLTSRKVTLPNGRIVIAFRKSRAIAKWNNPSNSME